MIFIHSFRPVLRGFVIMLLVMFGCSGLGGYALRDNLIGTGLILVAVLVALDTLRVLWMWLKSYSGEL